MATFLITGPDGKKYRVSGENAEGAFQALQQHLGAPSTPAAPQAELSAYEPGIMESLGNRLYDAANALGLPASRMRRDAQGVDAFVRGAADVPTFGFADEIAAGAGALTGVGGQQGNFSGNLELQRAIDERDSQLHPMARFAGQAAGAIATPMRAAQSTLGAIGQGAMLGGAYGFGSGEGGWQDRLQGAAIGAGIGGVAGGVVHKAANALSTRAARNAIPDVDDLRALSQAGYEAAENAGVIVRPEGMRRIATETVNDLAEFGYHPQLQPKIGTLLSEMERLGNTNTTYKGLDTLRKMASRVAGSNDPSEAALASRIINRLDDYMANLPADDLITGNAQQAAQGIRQGRDNWSRMRRAEMVDTARVKAERRAASTGTGGNLENTLRQNVRSILDNPRRSRGMSPAEIEMAERVVRGTPTQDALRLVGRLSPTTGGLSAMMNVGAAAFNPFLAIPGAVGLGAKTVADGMTRRNVQRLSEMVRSGGMTADDIAKLAAKGIGKEDIVRLILGVKAAEGVALPAASRLSPGLME